MTLDISKLGDIAARFDISDDEAERIAESVDSEKLFIHVWENHDWWTDKKASQNRRKAEQRERDAKKKMVRVESLVYESRVDELRAFADTLQGPKEA